MAEGTFGVVQSIGAKQNTQREYESVIILRPETAKPAAATAASQPSRRPRGACILSLPSSPRGVPC